MGSTRLPGKVMKDLIGLPMISHIVQRVNRARLIDEVVIAIPETKQNDCLKELCEYNNWNVFRGSEEDVLDRFYHAAIDYHADNIVRITADCPLIDHELIDTVIRKFKKSDSVPDYISNCVPLRTYPRGLDTEVIRFAALEKSWRGDTNPAFREHVTQYILHNPEMFVIAGSIDKTDNSSLRWTVDTPEDLTLITKIYNYFGNNLFSWRDVLKLVRDHPELTAINAHIKQKEILCSPHHKLMDSANDIFPYKRSTPFHIFHRGFS
jgi:spore coat polysaccharide biosynthesis protein SpsF